MRKNKSLVSLQLLELSHKLKLLFHLSMKTPFIWNIHRRKRLYRIVQSKCTKNIFLSVHKKHMRGFILHSMSLPVSKQQPHPWQVLHTTEKFQRASFQISVRQFPDHYPCFIKLHNAGILVRICHRNKCIAIVQPDNRMCSTGNFYFPADLPFSSYSTTRLPP